MTAHFSSCLSVLLYLFIFKWLLIWSHSTFHSIGLCVVVVFFKTNAVTRASKSNGMAREKTPLATEAPSDKRDRLTGWRLFMPVQRVLWIYPTQSGRLFGKAPEAQSWLCSGPIPGLKPPLRMWWNRTFQIAILLAWNLNDLRWSAWRNINIVWVRCSKEQLRNWDPPKVCLTNRLVVPITDKWSLCFHFLYIT